MGKKISKFSLMFATVEAAVAYLRRRGAPELADVLGRHDHRRRRIPRRAARGLLQIWRAVPPPRPDAASWLGSLSLGDTERLAARVSGGPSARAATRALLRRCGRPPRRRADDADPDDYPARFHRWLARRAPHAAAWWRSLADRVVLGRLSERRLGRTRRAVAARVITLGNTIDPLPAGEPLAESVARLVARIQHRDHGHRGRRSAQGDGSVLESWMRFFRGALRTGALEDDGGGGRSPDLSRHEVIRRMRRLERERPDVYRAAPRPKPVRTNAPLTLEDAERMLAASADRPLDRAVLLLLATTGLRAGALADLRVRDVVPPDGVGIAEEATVLEKYSRWRTVPLVPPVRAALAAHLSALGGGTDPEAPLFGGSRCVASTVVRRLGRLGGVPGRRSPHQFRTLLVNRAMAAGSQLDDVAQYLGHRSAATTVRHYWTAPSSSEPGPRALVEWEAARVLELQAELVRLTGGA